MSDYPNQMCDNCGLNPCVCVERGRQASMSFARAIMTALVANIDVHKVTSDEHAEFLVHSAQTVALHALAEMEDLIEMLEQKENPAPECKPETPGNHSHTQAHGIPNAMDSTSDS